MTKDDAKELLRYHGLAEGYLFLPKARVGFLGLIQQMPIELNEKNYHEIMTAIKVLAEDLRIGETVDREIITLLFKITYFSQCWLIDLQQSKLIRPEQAEQLVSWVGVISGATMDLLAKIEVEEVFDIYDNE